MRFRIFFWIALIGLCAACTTGAVIADPAPAPTTEPRPFVQPPTPTSAPTLTAGPWPTSTPILLPSPSPIPEIRLLFTGDVNPGRCVYHYASEADDMALPYRALADYLQGADITVGSLDAAISDYNPPTPCIETRNLLAPSAVAEGFRWAGFDVITVATNHTKDCGLVRGCDNESFFDTLAHLRAAGVQPVGGGHDLEAAAAPVIVSVHGVRFAFLGFSAIDPTLWATETTPGTAPFTPEVYLGAVRQAKARADVVIVLPHWGTEYSPRINWEQVKSAQALVDAGAALIVGNHPHHVQGVETFPDGAVAAYALGNFVFDQTWSDGTQYIKQGLMLRATFRGAHLQDVDLIPIHIYDDFQPRLAPPDEGAYILQVVADSSENMPQR
jgi:poly-gamma-glutamate synthesis protein (capsule biosynthesis protein)